MLTANVEHGCQMHSPVESVRSLVSVCFEEGAREVLADFAHRTQCWGVLNAFTTTPASELRTLHPFLAGPRTPSWAVYGAFDCRPGGQDPYGLCRRPFTWAVRAAYAGDMTMLEITRDFSASAHLRQDCAAQNLDPAENDPQATFHRAKAAAIRKGNLPMLRWLLTEIDLPVEPSLLTEAVHYHKYGIALWLVGTVRRPVKRRIGSRWCMQRRYAAVVWTTDCSSGSRLIHPFARRWSLVPLSMTQREWVMASRCERSTRGTRKCLWTDQSS
jgi:hypothetical protein